MFISRVSNAPTTTVWTLAYQICYNFLCYCVSEYRLLTDYRYKFTTKVSNCQSLFILQ
nr:MAG TPA_asm: hypothetical protein [Inoviridae sp.]